MMIISSQLWQQNDVSLPILWKCLTAELYNLQCIFWRISSKLEMSAHTFWDYFIAILVGVDPNFLICLWDWFVPQTICTLSLLHQANTHPNTPAYAYLYEPFDNNTMLLAPLQCATQTHEKLHHWVSWMVYFVDRWNLGITNEHYWCHYIFLKKTKADRVKDMVFFAYEYITQSVVSPDDAIMKAIGNLCQAITQ